MASSGGPLAWMQLAMVRTAKAKGTEQGCEKQLGDQGYGGICFYHLLKVLLHQVNKTETSSPALKCYHSPSELNCRCYSNLKQCITLICLQCAHKYLDQSIDV